MANPFAITGTIEGVAEVTATLTAFAPKVQRKVLRPAMTKATKPTVAAARRNVPAKSGLLKKAMGRKIKTYKASGAIVALIGARTGFRQEVVHDGRIVTEDPAKIAHLVEFGTKPHSLDLGSKSKAPSANPTRMHPGAKASGFLRKSGDQTREQTSTIFGQEVLAGVNKIAAEK